MGDKTVATISHPKLVDVSWRVEPPTETQPTAAVVVDLQVKSQPTKVGEAPEIRPRARVRARARGRARGRPARGQARRSAA